MYSTDGKNIRQIYKIVYSVIYILIPGQILHLILHPYKCYNTWNIRNTKRFDWKYENGKHNGKCISISISTFLNNSFLKRVSTTMMMFKMFQRSNQFELCQTLLWLVWLSVLIKMHTQKVIEQMPKDRSWTRTQVQVESSCHVAQVKLCVFQINPKEINPFSTRIRTFLANGQMSSRLDEKFDQSQAKCQHPN